MEFTPAFKKWFKGSKVVDENGEPLLVFHGTDRKFSVFQQTEDIGFHFGTRESAEARLEQMSTDDWGPENWIMVEAYLHIKNPLRMFDLFTWDPSDVKVNLMTTGVITRAEADEVDIVDIDQVQKWLKAKGYDGIVYENEVEIGGDSWIVFDSRQIKAVDNDGTFDADDPDIRSNPVKTRARRSPYIDLPEPEGINALRNLVELAGYDDDYNFGTPLCEAERLVVLYDEKKLVDPDVSKSLAVLVEIAETKKLRREHHVWTTVLNAARNVLEKNNFDADDPDIRSNPAGTEYPLADRNEWYGDADYAVRGGEIVWMTPQEYLKRVRPLKLDDASNDNIDSLVEHIKSGLTLDPLAIYADGKEDGRHRANAAIRLKIKKVPVIVFGEGRSVGKNPNYHKQIVVKEITTDPHKYYAYEKLSMRHLAESDDRKECFRLAKERLEREDAEESRRAGYGPSDNPPATEWVDCVGAGCKGWLYSDGASVKFVAWRVSEDGQHPHHPVVRDILSDFKTPIARLGYADLGYGKLAAYLEIVAESERKLVEVARLAISKFCGVDGRDKAFLVWHKSRDSFGYKGKSIKPTTWIKLRRAVESGVIFETSETQEVEPRPSLAKKDFTGTSRAGDSKWKYAEGDNPPKKNIIAEKNGIVLKRFTQNGKTLYRLSVPESHTSSPYWPSAVFEFEISALKAFERESGIEHNPPAHPYVRYKGKCWELSATGADRNGKVSLIDLQDPSTGISADPSEIRPCSDADVDGIEYFMIQRLEKGLKRAKAAHDHESAEILGAELERLKARQR